MTKARNIADLLDANGDVKSASLDNVPASDNASALTSGTLPDARLSNQVKVVKSANAPTSPVEGNLWYDSTNELLKVYVNSESAFVKVSPQIPSITGISGDITVETAGNLTLTGINFLTGSGTVAFTRGGSITNVSVTPTSDTSITVAVPSAIYTGASVGDSVSISFTNSDSQTSGIQTKTVVGRAVTLSSISGNIYDGASSTLTLTGVGFSATPLTVKFTGSNDTTATVASDTSATVVVPSAVYGQSIGTSISITVTNGDSITSSGVNKSVIDVPSGGTITSYGSYRVHTFLSSGNFVVPTGFTASADMLLVAGGGSGGVDSGGGGGAGGMLEPTSISLSAQTYSIVIGAGGASRLGSQNAGVGNKGSNSTGLGYTLIGGGAGRGWDNPDPGSVKDGGSGGGNSSETNNIAPGGAGSGTTGQGNNGGQSVGGFAGGGGGKGSAGQNAGSGYAGTGGTGGANNFRTGSNITYSAGGTGGWDVAGGQSSSNTSTVNGTTKRTNESAEQDCANNTGHGGNGANHNDQNSGAGGSGICVIRYQL